jgi:hypothetical protein
MEADGGRERRPEMMSGGSMVGVCYQMLGDSRRVTHNPEHWRGALVSHQQAAHSGENDKKCPACAELQRRFTLTRLQLNRKRNL